MADKVQPPSTGEHDNYARFLDFGDGTFGVVGVGRCYVWNSVSMAWEKMTQPGGVGGGGVDPVGLKNIAQNAINPATQETLASILAQVDVALSTRALESGGNLAAIKTAVQLIDDLYNALASVHTDQLRTDVISSALPTGAATQTTLATLLTEVVFTGRVGEVQATPTANTVLGRLKALETALALLLAETTFTGRLGEVQATPTANTLLGRLKDITDQVTPLLEEATFTGRLGEVQVSPTQYTVLERLKVLATLLNGGLPAALTAGGGLKAGLVDALPAGSANIGDVDVVSSALPTGAATSAKQDTEIAALQLIDDLRNALATVSTDKLRVSEVDPLPAGTNNIGDVDVLTLPSLPAGTNNIGDVDVLTLPALPAGSNNIGDVDVVTLPQPTSPTTTTSGVKTVTTAGTRVQLDNVACKAVSITAHATNTGLIYLGNSGVTALNGARLSPGQSKDIAMDNVNRFYIDAAVNGEGVSYLAVN